MGSVLILARLLSPEDYGLVTMVTVLTGFAPVLVSLGTPDAVVQRSNISEGEVSAVFWINMIIGCGTAVVLAICSPLIADFYGEPRLTKIAVIASPTFIIAALWCQHYALLRRIMRFRELAFIDVAASLLSTGGAIAIAFFGFDYWALVWRPIMQNCVVAIGVWLRCRWIPGKPTMTSGTKDILKFGLHLTGFTITDFLSGASDKVAIGYRNGVLPLGYYQNATAFYYYILDACVAPLHGVAVAGLSKAQGNLKELHRLWSKALTTLGFFVMPAFGILAITAQDLIVWLIGAKWSQAGFLLSILALRGIPHTVERTLGWLHVTAGRTDRWMRWGLLATFAQLVALLSGLPFGPTGVAVAYVICMYILFIPAVAYAGKPLGIMTNDVMTAVWRPLFGALLAAAIGFTVRYSLLADAPGMQRMIILTFVYMAIYVITVVGLLRVRTPLEVVLQLGRDYLPSGILASPKS
jgi:PST family polysaccharide transporter